MSEPTCRTDQVNVSFQPISLASLGTFYPSLKAAPPSLANTSFPPPICILCPMFLLSHHGQFHPSFPSLSLAPCLSPLPALPVPLFSLPQAYSLHTHLSPITHRSTVTHLSLQIQIPHWSLLNVCLPPPRCLLSVVPASPSSFPIIIIAHRYALNSHSMPLVPPQHPVYL